MITITIKGISKEAHRELKRRAVTHGRSLNTEAIAVLESSVRSTPVDTQALLARVRARRDTMKFKGKSLDIETLYVKTVIVADTNLIAYFAVRDANSELADAVFATDPVWVAPLLWRSEYPKHAGKIHAAAA